YTHEEFSQLFVSDIDVGSTRKEDFPKLWAQISDGNVVSVETIHKRKDGSEYPVEVRVGPLNIHGELHIIAIAHNISERLATLKELAIHNERLESLYRISQYKYTNKTEFLDFVLDEAIKLTE